MYTVIIIKQKHYPIGTEFINKNLDLSPASCYSITVQGNVVYITSQYLNFIQSGTLHTEPRCVILMQLKNR